MVFSGLQWSCEDNNGSCHFCRGVSACQPIPHLTKQRCATAIDDVVTSIDKGMAIDEVGTGMATDDVNMASDNSTDGDQRASH